MLCAGPIPKELGCLFKLKVLWLNKNQLTGEMRARSLCFRHVSVLSSITHTGVDTSCYKNRLPLPTYLSGFLSSSFCLGHVPKELGDLGDLECLGLPGNQLSGEGIDTQHAL